MALECRADGLAEAVRTPQETAADAPPANAPIIRGGADPDSNWDASDRRIDVSKTLTCFEALVWVLRKLCFCVQKADIGSLFKSAHCSGREGHPHTLPPTFQRHKHQV
jgi:hypothetical protein